MKFFFTLLFFFFGSSVYSQEVAVQFEEANQVYRAANFQRAAALYEQILKNGYESPALYYNLGNAYFKLQNIPAAILNYERAKKLSPRDEDIGYNLRLANLRVTDKIEPVPQLFYVAWWKMFINLFSSDGWALVMIAGLWCTMIAGVLMVLIRSSVVQRMSFVAAILIFILTLLSAVGLFQRIQQERSETFGIVFTQSVSVKSAPDVSSTDLFVLHDGVKVEFMDAVGDWRKIRLADGKIGWLPVSSVEAI